jgi:hypothetical protein
MTMTMADVTTRMLANIVVNVLCYVCNIILFVLVYERFVRALGSSSPHFLFCEFIFIAFDVIAYFMFFLLGSRMR